MKLCFYGVMRNFGGRDLNHRSIDNQKIVLIHSKDLYAAVSYTKYREFDATPDNIAIHEWIIASIKKQTPVIPFPINSIVGDTIGKGVLYSHYAELRNVLKKIGKKEEFIVRVHRDIDKKLSKFYKLSGVSPRPQNKHNEKTARTYNKILDIAGHKLAGRIHNQFDEVADESHYERLISDERLVEGCYLVSSRKINELKQTFTWVESLYPELHFFLQGPQPPYHFNPVNITSLNTQLHGRKHSG